ncbi:P2-like prophage tail protein X [Bosea sp. CRIB-10]|uniref:tail protein X n=1 Tax=Bosea sp. CRIB-10 TaxID=378404 RepID=UPI0008F38441|nr:tail protein X [Bosea sp. CRIB-10]SFC22090.1 P2-like prophage tail protein X [Bosea sp. CRIB-10]
MARVKVTREGMTVDLIVFRHFGNPDTRLVELTYELNRGLADLGTIVPVGTEIDLPEAPPSSPPRRETVRLWD